MWGVGADHLGFKFVRPLPDDFVQCMVVQLVPGTMLFIGASRQRQQPRVFSLVLPLSSTCLEEESFQKAVSRSLVVTVGCSIAP
jgi:hypothetical protein